MFGSIQEMLILLAGRQPGIARSTGPAPLPWKWLLLLCKDRLQGCRQSHGCSQCSFLFFPMLFNLLPDSISSGGRGMCMCVYVHVGLPSHVCAWVCGGRPSTLGSIFRNHPPCFLRCDLSLGLEAHQLDYSDWPSGSKDVLVCFLSAGIANTHGTPSFYMWVLSTELHAP